MRRYPFGIGVLLAIVALLSGAALVACSSGTSSSDKTATAAAATGSGGAPTQTSGGAATETTGGAPTESTAATAAPTTASSSSSSSATLPSDACTLMTEAEASQLAGTAVTGNTSTPKTGVFKGGTTAPCDFYGPNGNGDHPVTLWVTSFADAGAAQTFMQGQTDLYKIGAQGFQSASGIGDEAIEYKVDSGSIVQARVGSLAILLQVGNSDFPGPDLSAVENAVKTIISRL
jgi:hypothetical protein